MENNKKIIDVAESSAILSYIEALHHLNKGRPVRVWTLGDKGRTREMFMRSNFRINSARDWLVVRQS